MKAVTTLHVSAKYLFERIAVTNAKVVLPVCEALAMYIEKYKPKKVMVLSDVSLLK